LRTIPQTHIRSELARPCEGDVGDLHAVTEGRVWELPIGHTMMLTEPELIADKLAATAEWLPAAYRN
jgi:hypothetical protein